jgi:hypothetical protein
VFALSTLCEETAPASVPTVRRSIPLTVRGAGDTYDTSDIPLIDNATYTRIAYTAHQALSRFQRLLLQEYRLYEVYQ